MASLNAQSMSNESRSRAVVLGASMGGLLAARVLSDLYETVTVIERDRLPDDPVNRRGVPQGKHPHVLLGKAVEVIGNLFPGLFDQVVADGAIRWDDGDLSRLWQSFSGHLTVRSAPIPDPAALTDYHLSRPLLEFAVRRAVREIPNVDILEEHDVVGLTADLDGDRITGVRIEEHHAGAKTRVKADLVVDATGRGSRASVFLEEFGYDRVRVDEVEVRIAYATLPVRIPRAALHELVVIVTPIPSRPTLLVMLACENDTYLVMCGTVGGEDPPADRRELLDFVEGLAPGHVAEAVRSAEPLAEVAQYRIPSSRWRRYDQLARTPEGLVVFGDAICSFNPIYGQGMTVAAIEAEVLRECLRTSSRKVPQRFYRESAKAIQAAWRTAVGSDLALPQVPGRPALSVRIMNAYQERVLTAMETDPVVAQQFLRVLWMLDRPSALARPAMVLRIAKALITGARNREQTDHLEQLPRSAAG
jgi:2-polyprenyl-6-methoxyphenol hydroxylase-like FAD-dependent oxidoreductase